ncbi:hypothetical protein S83_051574, partial [Arachis hypogaea]
PIFQNRKGDITINVLGVVSLDMQFIYVLVNWEDLAADSRVLRDTLFRNGFSILQGQKYYLSEFNPHNQPNIVQELFNMKHSEAKNVIERTFGTQGRVIIACYFLHNHIRRVMVVDPINEIVDQNMLGVDGGINLHKKYVTNGEEDIMLDNCDHFSMCEAVYRNIDFILLMCLCSCTSVVH